MLDLLNVAQHSAFYPHGRVAQLAEHSTLNRQVGGSIPPASTNDFKKAYWVILVSASSDCGGNVGTLFPAIAESIAEIAERFASRRVWL